MENPDCKNLLVFVEIVKEKPVNVGLEMLTLAHMIAKDKGEKVIAVLIGKTIKEAAKQSIIYGADESIMVDGLDYESYESDKYTYIMEILSKKHQPFLILIGATQFGKDLAGRLAARLSTGCITDAIDAQIKDSRIHWTRPVYSGTLLSKNVMEGVVPQIVTVRAGALKKMEPDTLKEIVVRSESITVPNEVVKTKVVDTVKEITESVNLEEAEVIIAGGRGMGSAENFAKLKELADLLGGVIGATRAAMEAGWVSRAHQVGQSGKIVAPKLYIGFGISGAAQHISGITESDFIVAVNKDEDAPIFDVANIGIVGNAMEALEVMIGEIKKIKGK